MKTCSCCFKEKGDDDFYKKMAQCKDCWKLKVKKNREKNIGYYREYDAIRFQKDPRVKERHLRYQQSEAGKEALKKSKKKWCENNLVKRAANVIIGNAVRDGKIIKPNNCESCGSLHDRIHGHHDDYAYPMVVRWLCPKCHTAWHKENGEALNG